MLDFETKQELLKLLGDREVRQRFKQAIDKRKREVLKHSPRREVLSTMDPKARKRQLYKLPCLGGCGRLAWHPPHGKGRCISCGVKAAIPTRKPRTSRKSGT